MTFDLIPWNKHLLVGPIAMDTETEDIKQGVVPDLVLYTVSDGSNKVYYGTEKTMDEFIEMHEDNLKIFHNAPFDLAVMNIPSLYNKPDKIHDTMIFWKLLWLAKEGIIYHQNSLATITEYLLKYTLDKSKHLRTGWYRGMTFSKERLKYAAEDAFVTYQAWKKLYPLISNSRQLLSYPVQIRGAVSLEDIERRGIGFDLKVKEKVIADLQDNLVSYKTYLKEHDYIPGKKGNTKILYAQVEKFIKEHNITNWPVTIKKQTLVTSEEILEPYINQNKFFKSFIKYKKINKLITFVEKINTNRIYPRYDLLKVSGRTSSNNPNLQQMPREGGIRECFVPLPNHKFIIADYKYLELVTLAQVCYKKFKYSRLRDILNQDIDPHTWFAQQILQKKEITRDERQKAKAANFGFPAGLGVKNFIQLAKKDYKVEFSPNEAMLLKEKWLSAYPEMKKYLKAEGMEPFTVKTLTGRIRANCRYTAAKNTPFQGLAADGAKLALWNCFMAGLKTVGFIHDEIIIESPVNKLEEEHTLLRKSMIEGMRKVVPDVKIGVDSRIEERWVK